MVVIVIMCFLLCLTAGVVYMVRQSAAAWLRDIDSEITVQVQPNGKPEELDKRVEEIVAFLRGQIGVTKVTPLTKDQLSELVKPWLGQVASLEALPMPELIAIEIDRDNPPDITPLRAALTAKFPDSSLDDHRRWRKQIRSVTGTLAVAGLGVMLLVFAATVAIIIAAARSAMASNREIIEVLNFVGAEENFIVSQFERHFLKLGIKAGIMGASAAGLIFFLMPYISDYTGGSTVADAEIRRLMGTRALDLGGYGILIAMVAIIALLCLITSHYGVRRILDAQNR